MVHRFFSALRRLAHACSDFGSYFMNLQRRGCNSCLRNCYEGGPNMDEARQDYLGMIHYRHDSPYIGHE